MSKLFKEMIYLILSGSIFIGQKVKEIFCTRHFGLYRHKSYLSLSLENSVLQPLEVVHNNILRTITYNNYRCHITPL